jgi:hypothetical protein
MVIVAEDGQLIPAVGVGHTWEPVPKTTYTTAYRLFVRFFMKTVQELAITLHLYGSTGVGHA